MKNVLFISVAAGVLLALFGFPATAENHFLVDVKQIGQIKFAVPESPSHRKYLGVSDRSDFNLTDVKAEYIIIEIFNMYCTICQKAAPKVNQCHGLIEGNPEHNGMVKLVGIGTGNSPLEVDVFRTKYSIEFPLLPDENFMIQKAFSEPIRTPTFVTVKNLGKKGLELVNLHVGELDTAEALLKNLPLAQ